MTEVVKITENVTPYLDIVMGRLRDQRPTLAKVVPLVREYFERQFETQGQYGGQSWAPLTQATMERRKGFLGPELMLTGTLWASLTQEGAKYGYAVLNEHSVRVGTRDPVAHLLEGGTVKMQARNIEGDPPPQEVDRYADLIADDLLR